MYPNPTNRCWACKHSYMEPSGDARLVCGETGDFGVWADIASSSDGHCGPKRPKFEQHPDRNPDGTLK